MTSPFRSGWARAASAVAAALVIVVCTLVAGMPFIPNFPAPSLDDAWRFAINEAVARHLVLGRDIIFTFGPYASVYTFSYDPGTDALMIGGCALVTAALVAGLAAIATRRIWIAALFALILSQLWLRDPLFFVLPVLLLVVLARSTVGDRPRSRPLAIVAAVLLVTATGLLPLIKGTFVACSIVGIGLGAVILVSRRRLLLAFGMIALYVGCTCVFWRMAHQPLGALAAFFIAQSRIVGGYSDAMALPGPGWQVALYGSLALFVLAANARASFVAGLSGLAVLGGAAAVLWIGFKAGFVRQDAHVSMSAATLGLIACLLAVAGAGIGPTLGLLAALAGLIVLDGSAEGGWPNVLARIETNGRGTVEGIRDRLHPNALRDRFADSLRAIRADHPLPTLPGSSDIYEDGQSILLAHGMAWSPRPVLQSYSAYTPYLEAADARHLDGDHAPENVLFEIQSIDDRLPSLDDGPSWLALLSRYDAVGRIGQMAILRHVPGVRPLPAMGPATTSSARLGRPIAVANDDARPVWAVVDVRPTTLGRLLAFVLRPPPLHITMNLASGRTFSYRFVAGMGRAGFLVSPVVGDATEFLALEVPGSHAFPDDQVTSFSIVGAAYAWKSRFEVALRTVRIPERSTTLRFLFKAPRPGIVDPGTGADCALDLANGSPIDPSRRLATSGLLRLDGWGFGTAPRGVEPDTISLWLRDPDGQILTVPADLDERPDVGRFLHQPWLDRIGYQALLDLRGLHGRYTIGLNIATGSRTWNCPLAATVTLAQPS